MYHSNRHSLIKVIDELIDYIETNINNQIFLCHLDSYLMRENDPDWDIKLKQTLEYIESQKPTHLRNKEHYNNPYFLRYNTVSGSWWIYPYKGRPGMREETNKYKLTFLDHLKDKLIKR